MDETATALCSTFSCVASVINSSHCVFLENTKQHTDRKGHYLHYYIIVAEQVLSYHIEAEPPPEDVKADLNACPSRAVGRYRSIFISIIEHACQLE